MARDQLKAEIERLRSLRTDATQIHAQSMNEMRLHLQELQSRTEKILSQKVPIHRYASELKGKNTPSHIILLQAQVCREIHHYCGGTAQFQLLEEATKELKLLADEQQRIQLKCLLWAVEAKAELRQQEEDEIYQRVQSEESEESSSGIDHLVAHISCLDLKNSVTTLEETEELTPDDLKTDKKNGNEKDIESLLDEDKEPLHRSLPTIISEGLVSNGKKLDTRGSLVNTSTWNSEKPQVAWWLGKSLVVHGNTRWCMLCPAITTLVTHSCIPSQEILSWELKKL